MGTNRYTGLHKLLFSGQETRSGGGLCQRPDQ